MIVAERKPLDEIIGMVRPFKNILILGCGTCVTVCNVGGEREVSLLDAALRVAITKGMLEEKVISQYTVKRQCDKEFLTPLLGKAEEIDAILSLACGVGVQVLADTFSDITCIPGVNTIFMGAQPEMGVWDERCIGCGDCRLFETLGICPLSRCAKGILNGPCGGSKNGKCEANKDVDCAWLLIYDRLERRGQLEKMRQYYPPRDYGRLRRPKRVTIL